MLTIYGIKNCDKCRAAQKWFSKHGIEFQFHDLRSDGLNDKLVGSWQALAEAGTLLNKRSQTWRQIPENQRENLSTAGERKLILSYPTVVKRPLVIEGSTLHIGYDEATWKKLF